LDGHIAFDEALAGQADTGQALFGQFLFFGDGHFCRFATDKGNAAGGALAVATAGMQLVDGGVLNQSKDQTFASLYIERANIFYCQLRHENQLLCV